MHRHIFDLSDKSMGTDDAKVALCGFPPIFAFSIFKTLLVILFVTNASVFPANMHQSRTVAMPHNTVDIAVALHADLDIKFFFFIELRVCRFIQLQEASQNRLRL